MSVAAKICGLSTEAAVAAAVQGGAAYVGFVFFPRSPRHVTPERAAELAAPARAAGVAVVAVTVDATDEDLARIAATLKPDLIQLHGAETPERVRAIGEMTGAKTIRALRVRGARDLDTACDHAGACDHLMFDAAPPKDAALPGGNGAVFDWAILKERSFPRPWFLAGGLDAGNVAQALATSGAPMVDVSSGVERAPGVKDPGLIAAFLKAVREA